MMTYDLPNNSKVAVHDIFDSLPLFMYEADCLYIDPPYNQSLYTNFCNRAEVNLSQRNTKRFTDFTSRLFYCIQMISPKTLFLEIGKQSLNTYQRQCERLFPYLAIYQSTYYHLKKNQCFILHADTVRREYVQLHGVDEEDSIAWICANHPYQCIGDLCMGRGLVGKHAYLNGKRFVGTELNQKRLAVLVDFIHKKEMSHAKA